MSLIETAILNRPLGSLLTSELEAVSALFDSHLASRDEDVNDLCVHIERYRGKMLRPTLVVLSSLAVSGSGSADDLDERQRTLAAVVEMIHMATLVHDDILDESEVRRGGATINSLHGNEVAVMLGDYLISKAFHLCSTLGDPSINLALGEVTNILCEGEVIQLQRRNDMTMTESLYLDVVGRKTGSLIGACCRLGGVLGGGSDSCCAALQSFGQDMGVAFQITDDVLDLVGETAITGKTVGRDLDLGKMTLPLIRLRAELDEVDHARFDRTVQSRDRSGLQDLLDSSEALDSTMQAARDVVSRAKSQLEILPPGPALELMLELSDGVLTRHS
ncbi:MAG: polyprenyl synthetase family protein [Planctomycetota bacterium]|nr:polyprenyl synthetase family protein [Planctomycetota bacterium]